MPKSRIYLAYGSNLNVWQMAERCPTAKMLGTAELKGYELLFRGKPQRAVATIEPKIGASVPVLLWKLRSMDETALDRFEGVPNTYNKQMVAVEYGKGSIEAMTYVMVPGFHAGLPSVEYLHRIAVGYDHAGFAFDPLTAALEHSKELMRLEYEDNIAFLDEVTANRPGGMDALDEDQLGYFLSLYTKHQFGELECDEQEDQCREYLSSLDEPDAGQGSLFDMKWGW